MARRRRSLGDLTAEQQRDIAEAPQVAPSPYAAVCAPLPPDPCPPQMATPGWGDARAWFPESACVSPAQRLARESDSIPWWKLVLIAVGGIIAVREVLE